MFSVPFGITTPDKPLHFFHSLAFGFRSKNRVYYFESTLTPNLFWIDLHKVDFSPNASIKKLSLTHGEVYAGDVVKDFKDSRSFTFMFELPK